VSKPGKGHNCSWPALAKPIHTFLTLWEAVLNLRASSILPSLNLILPPPHLAHRLDLTMSAPPNDGYGQFQGQPYDQQAAQPYEDQPQDNVQQAGAPGKKKKRGYAAQAFDVGTGANATAGGAMQAGAQPYGMPPVQNAPAYGGYGASDPQAAASPAGFQQPYGQQPAAPQQPAYGYQAPDQGYQSQVPQPGPGTPGVAGITQGMGGMQIGPQPGNQQPPQQGVHAVRPAVLNQLYPTDLLNQPFNASELDLPPPPIFLPPNSSVTPSPEANCPPRYIRSTVNAVPTTNSLLKKSKLPLALVIQPYGALHDSEDPVPLVQDQVIARCRRCRTYINPYVTFLDHGHRWKCNMCNLSNDVPQAFDWDAAAQQSVDRWQRHELNHSVVEFVAPQEYMVRPPQPLVYLFLFDVSYAAVSSGLLATSARTILDSLSRIPNVDRRTRLGFIAVDSSLHYFSVPKDADENAETNMLVVSDLDEPFLPVPHDLLVPLAESRQSIEKFLQRLPQMFVNNQSNGSCMGPALRAGHKLISALGGKIVVLTASLPNLGVGKLDMREDKKLLGTSKESGLLQPSNSFYKSFAVECSKNQVSIDMFLFSSQYQDVASLSNLPRYTGGQTWFYPGWHASRPEDALKFASEFSDFLSSEIGLEAVLRVRATTGLRMNTFYGNFFNRSSDLCAFPAFPRDQCYVVEVAIDENLGKTTICLQAAVLHTTCNGERRIRVMTLCLPTTTNLSDMYASADPVAITTYFSHKAVERVLSTSLDAARTALQSKLTELLQTFKKELAGGSMGGGLQFPANLRSLPVLFLGLIKNVGLRNSAQIPSDIRSAALCLLSTLPPPLLMRYIYPRLYSLHDMSDNAGVPDQETGAITLPPAMNLSSERFAPYGLYLIDDGQTQFLWVGRDAVPQLLADVFGVEDRTQLQVGKGRVPELENDFNERIRAVVQKSRDHRSLQVGSITVPHLYVVREDGEPSLKLWAQTLLVEDRAEQSVSAAQWLGTLREKVVQ
jgi:protein transport protein SEC24